MSLWHENRRERGKLGININILDHDTITNSRGYRQSFWSETGFVRIRNMAFKKHRRVYTLGNLLRTSYSKSHKSSWLKIIVWRSIPSLSDGRWKDEVIKGGSNFWVSRQNPTVWLFKWNLFASVVQVFPILKKWNLKFLSNFFFLWPLLEEKV